MILWEVEAKVCERLGRSISQAVPETMRKFVPIRRNQFDNFIYEATRWALDDGAPDSFSWACKHLRAAQWLDSTAGGDSAPFIPPTVAERITRIVSRWSPGEQAVGAIDLPLKQAVLRDELYLSLGGDLGDGVAAAGRRLSSRMWSARIGDGFVHPAVGGYIWNGNAGSNPGSCGEVDDPLIAAIYAVGDLAARWQSEPDHRPAIDREIVKLADDLGWKL